MRAHSKYNASLLSTAILSEEQRHAAEEKFLENLERVLGGSSAVRGAYCEFLAVRSMRAENPSDPRSPDEMLAVHRWEKAAEEAKRTVFRQLNIVANDACFELHVWNSRTR